jgi:ferric-dicitrate binding protein FerR (iron transport regulator)
VNLYTSWIDGYFRFEAQPLETIMRNISRWYNIEINFESQELKEKKLTGKIYRFDDFTVIAGMIGKISGTKIQVRNNIVSISE